VAVTVPDAVAFAERVAAVADATAERVAPAGMPVPVIVRPTSDDTNVPAGAVRAVEALVVVTDTERPSGVRPVAIQAPDQNRSVAAG
jgi:hypothetical protein